MSIDQITASAADVAAHTWLPEPPPIADLLPVTAAEDLLVRRSATADGTPLVEVAHRAHPDRPLLSLDPTDVMTLVGQVAQQVGAMHVRDGAA